MKNNIDERIAKTLFSKCYTKEHFSNWFQQFIGIKFPDSIIDEHSNSSPLSAAYECYSAIRDDLCKTVPGYIWLSSRDSYKTLQGSALNLIIFLHFRISIAHMAAIKDQSEKSLQYFNTFIRYLKPYLEYHKWSVVGEAKDRIQLIDDKGKLIYIRVIVATKAGGNSEHVSCMSWDELEVLSPEGIKAYKESKNIPSRINNDDGTGIGPLRIKYSTRKYAGGFFGREIDNAPKTGEKVRQWNLLDVTERCSEDRHQPGLPKITRYIKKTMDLETITESLFENLPEKDKNKYSKIEAFSGCSSCKLLPVCKTKLALRNKEDVGGLFKNIDFVIGVFGQNNAEEAESQLLCWRPSSSGMVYPRFSNISDGTGNVFTLSQAYFQYMGEEMPKDFTQIDLVNLLISKGIKFHCGTDWGYSNAFSIIVTAKMPNGQWWILESIAVRGLEFEQMMDTALKIKEKYQKPLKWFADTAMPMFIKAFSKNGMPCAEFKKDVMGGIEAVRGQIASSTGVRRLKVIDDGIHNNVILNMFKNHVFKLNSLGEPTQDPDDTPGVADSGDALRYAAQNLFQAKGKNNLIVPEAPPLTQEEIQKKFQDDIKKGYSGWVSTEIKKHTEEPKKAEDVNVSKNGSIIWDID